MAGSGLPRVKGSEATPAITPADRPSPPVRPVGHRLGREGVQPRMPPNRAGAGMGAVGAQLVSAPHSPPDRACPRHPRRADNIKTSLKVLIGLLQALRQEGGGGRNDRVLSSSGCQGTVSLALTFLMTLNEIGPFHRLRKPRLEEVKSHAQRHRAGKCQRWHSSLGSMSFGSGGFQCWEEEGSAACARLLFPVPLSPERNLPPAQRQTLLPEPLQAPFGSCGTQGDHSWAVRHVLPVLS